MGGFFLITVNLCSLIHEQKIKNLSSNYLLYVSRLEIVLSVVHSGVFSWVNIYSCPHHCCITDLMHDFDRSCLSNINGTHC